VRYAQTLGGEEGKVVKLQATAFGRWQVRYAQTLGGEEGKMTFFRYAVK
jgi:hypothetical protein